MALLDDVQSLGKTKVKLPTVEANTNALGLNPNKFNAQDSWNRNKLPQFYKGGAEMRVGNTPLDMTDPRILASVAAPTTFGLSLLPYAIGRQVDNIRQDRRLEKQYEPIAERDSALAAQNANYGGTQGGSGTASSQQAFENILNQLIQAKRQVRQRQLAQEMQAVSALMSLFGYGAGTKPGAGPDSNVDTGSAGSYGPSEYGE